LPPLRIVQVHVLSTRHITQLKTPILIEYHPFSRARISKAKRCCTQEQTKSCDYIPFPVHF
jgi:hypothetical protein